jgi:hypothetical protein
MESKKNNKINLAAILGGLNLLSALDSKIKIDRRRMNTIDTVRMSVIK